MKRYAFIALGILIAATCVLGQASQEVGTQTVLILVHLDFHEAELETVLQALVDYESDIYVYSWELTESQLRQKIPERFFNLMPSPSGGPRVTVNSAPDELNYYDKIVTMGSGWSAARIREHNVTMQQFFDFLGTQLSDHTVVCGIGAGIYPIVASGVLPQGSEVPAYPCDDLSSYIRDHGYKPREAPMVERRDGQEGPPIVEMFDHEGLRERFLGTTSLNGSAVVISPIPNTWYPLDEEGGVLLVWDYRDEYTNAIDATENLYRGIPLPTAVQIAFVFSEGWVKLYNTTGLNFDIGRWTLQSVDPETGELYDSFTLPTGEDRSAYSFEPYTSELAAHGAQLIRPGNLDIPPGSRVELLDPDGNRRSVKSCCYR